MKTDAMPLATSSTPVMPLDITVAPDSGDGELKGIAGSTDIIMEGGRHDYVFTYTLPS